MSPHVEKVSLSFNEHSAAPETLQGLFGPFKMPEGQVESSGGIGRKMIELRLNLLGVTKDVDFWKSWAASVMSERKAIGLPIFSIYGLWKGDCEYLPLT